MPINPDLLISAPILQDFLIDKDGTPMSNGTVTCYHDNSRTTLKNWYYQSGTPGGYTYIPLPNPLRLSASGTICDSMGIDTIPFFYPYSERDDTQLDPYHIVIENFGETNEITRDNFPFLGASRINPSAGTSFKNLIVNNGFWHNILPNYTNTSSPLGTQLSAGGTSNFLAPTTVNIGTLTTLYTGAVSPSQHDGFSFPDVQFIKNNLSANEVCTFLAFPFSSSLLIPGTNSPEYYLNHQSTEGTGETLKGYLFPIALHINNLANLNYTVSIQAQSNSSPASTIQLALLQFLGTGAATPSPSIISNTPITLTTAWASYSLTDIFPSPVGLTTSQTEDDAFYLLVMMPLNQVCNINFTKPSIYLTTGMVPAYDFQTYDQVNSIICSPRTADLRPSFNQLGVTSFGGMIYGAFGWVYANDGTIGSRSSGATSRANADTWPLYATLWNRVSNTYAPVTGGRGTSAYADFIANKPIALTKILSRALISVGPGAGLTGWVLGQTGGAESASTALTADNLAPHNHPGSSAPTGVSPTTTTVFLTGLGSTATQTPINVATQGLGTPFSTPTISPFFACDLYFKL